MTDATGRLPRGRHGLSRAEVEATQRLRLAAGTAEAMRTKGYVGTPVADILKAAGVSRETFYELHTDKLACFLDAVDLVAAVLDEHLVQALDRPGSPLERFDRAFAGYLATLGREPGFARLVLVEVFAAGPVATARRTALQQRIVDRLVDLFAAEGDRGRFALEALVAAVSSLVTGPLVDGDLDRLAALHAPVLDHVRALVDGGVLGG